MHAWNSFKMIKKIVYLKIELIWKVNSESYGPSTKLEDIKYKVGLQVLLLTAVNRDQEPEGLRFIS